MCFSKVIITKIILHNWPRKEIGQNYEQRRYIKSLVKALSIPIPLPFKLLRKEIIVRIWVI